MIEYLIPASVIGFCAYMSYRGKKKADAINERIKKFQEECLNEGINLTPYRLFVLSKKYNLVSIIGNSQTLDEIYNPIIKQDIKINDKEKLEAIISLN